MDHLKYRRKVILFYFLYLKVLFRKDLDERLNAEFAINEKYSNKSNELSRKHTTESASIVTGKQAIKNQVAHYADYTHTILSAANNLAQQLLSMKIQEVEQQQRIQGDRIKTCFER